MPVNALYTGLPWKYAPFGCAGTLEAESRTRIYSADRNSDSASGYWVANLRADSEQETLHWPLSEFTGLDNLANRAYVG